MRPTCVLAAWLLACAPSPEVATARLALRALPSCELPRTGSITVRASGDFPSELRQMDLDSARVLDGFPPDTRWLAIEAGAGAERAGGLIARGAGDQQADALLLPFGRSCPLGDPLAAAAPGSALAALPDGGLLIAGGRQAGGTAALAHAAVLPPGAALARAIPAGMLLRRAGASATAVGTRVVVAGGGADERGPAHDTFEVYDQERDAFDNAQSANLSGGPRREHGAARLPDGRVLIAGGVAEPGGRPLASAELIALDAGDSRLLDAGLLVARAAPQLLVLDDGTVLVALGLDEQGRAVAEVERFDPERQMFERVAQLPEHPRAAVAALEGGRVVYVGCGAPDVLAATCALRLLVPDGDGFVVLPSQLDAVALARAGLSGLLDLRAAALGDSRVLVTGRDPWDVTARRAFVIDPSLPSIARVDASRVPDHVVPLSDGAVAELDAAGASLRRNDVQSELDDAPDPVRLGPDTLSVALDVAERWARQDDGLLARVQARFDLPRLRFAAVRVELELEGEGSLLLEPEAAPALEIAIGADRLSLGDCSLQRAGAGALAVERDGERIVLHSGGRVRTCSATRPLGERVGVALRAAARARIRALRVVRL